MIGKNNETAKWQKDTRIYVRHDKEYNGPAEEYPLVGI